MGESYHLVFFVLSCLVLFSSLCRPVDGRKNVSVQCHDSEREALLQFKRGITRDECGLLRSWGQAADCCQWRGIRCSNHTGHIIALNAGGSNGWVCLEGKVSLSLGKLKHLRQLNLAFNNFDDKIPHQLGNLYKLRTLDLSVSGLHGNGSLQWLSRLTRLRYLDLTEIDLGNPTDWMQIVSSLSSLTVLSMDHCSLSARMPSSLQYVNSSSSLNTIILSNNNFNDSTIFRWLFNLRGITTRLVHLDLSWNSLEGPVPVLNAFHRLSYLDLSYNQKLELPISNNVWNMPSLTRLFLSNNNFNGSVFQIVSRLCNLQQLSLTDNNFTDELTYVFQTALGCADKALVTTLDLGNNRFSGSIPDTINSFSSLKELYLDGNNLNGTITQGIGQLSKLEILDISSNSFNGSLTSEHFLHLSSLQAFLSGGNPRLVVNISDDWFPPFQLNALSLRSCKLGPHFPMWLRTQKSLSILDISDAEIFNIVPVSFWNSLPPNLNYFNLSHNQISGVIPDLAVRFYELEEIDLSSNLFEGVVPSWVVCNYTLYLNNNRFTDANHILCPKTTSYMSELHLSDNLFSAELPDCWENLSYLSIIHLENNKFYGSVPKSIAYLNELQYLDLHNNSFIGHLPSSLKNLKYLRILNLDYNLFTGHIPQWIGTAIPNLGALNLRGNMFLGELPLSICQLSSLQILDVSGNNISGVIPKCLQNLTAMGKMLDSTLNFPMIVDDMHQVIIIEHETTTLTWKREEQMIKDTLRLYKSIDLSDNELTGEIPDGITRLTGLGALDLSGNKLTGSIPPEIGELSELQLLDFSNNQLTGHIPESLAKVSNLEIFDVSNNKLSGEIPLSTQLQSFDPSGNNITGIIPKCVHGLRAMGKMRDCSLVFTLFGGSMGDLHQPLYFLPETVTMTWKREEQTFKRSIGLVKSIDLSDNELTGEIPDGITHLTGLVSLDFSGNKLTGNLPPAIGKLSELEFLDFSNNQLTGNIPESLAKVSSLGTFNVSNNKLSGQIPLSTQLQGFDPSSYTGNPGLCGAPLSECPGDRAPADARHRFDSTTSQDKHDDDGVFPGLYISVVFGLIVGFWGVCGTLAVKRSLRWAYFRLLDDIYDRVYVITVLFVAKVWRKP